MSDILWAPGAAKAEDWEVSIAAPPSFSKVRRSCPDDVSSMGPLPVFANLSQPDWCVPAALSGILLLQIFQLSPRGFGQRHARSAGGTDDAGLKAGLGIDRGRLDRVSEHDEFDVDLAAGQASGRHAAQALDVAVRPELVH